MRYAIYLSGYIHYAPQYTLFDMVKNEIVWTGPKTSSDMIADAGRMPVWNPISNVLTYSFITDQNKFGNYYFISLDGELTQMTQFEQTEIMGLYGGWLANPSWSPDGRYLAFKAAQGADGPIRLYIWDNIKKVALMPCLPDEDLIDVGYVGNWSFDSAHFLITLGYPNKDLSDGSPLFVRYNTVVLDMFSNSIIELPDQDHRGEYTSLYGDGHNELLGWVNWEIP
jgi:dipeptidyl aminopeptidase/acylaminoacyl peptidase